MYLAENLSGETLCTPLILFVFQPSLFPASADVFLGGGTLMQTEKPQKVGASNTKDQGKSRERYFLS